MIIMKFTSKYLGDISKDDKVHFYVAPDGSTIRKLPDGEHGGLAHCVLPPRLTSKAVKHKTVEELWYCLSGGKFWRKLGDEEKIIDLKPDMCFTIPVGVHFQFKNEKDIPLSFLITTIPIWPGPDEAVDVDDYWQLPKL